MSESKQNDVTIEFRRGSILVQVRIPTSPQKVFVLVVLVMIFGVTIVFSLDETVRKALLELLLDILNTIVIFSLRRLR